MVGVSRGGLQLCAYSYMDIGSMAIILLGVPCLVNTISVHAGGTHGTGKVDFTVEFSAFGERSDMKVTAIMRVNDSYPTVTWDGMKTVICDICPGYYDIYNQELRFMIYLHSYVLRLFGLLPHASHITVTVLCFFGEMPFACAFIHVTDRGRVMQHAFDGGTSGSGNFNELKQAIVQYDKMLINGIADDIKRRWWPVLLKFDEAGRPEHVLGAFWKGRDYTPVFTCTITSPSLVRMEVKMCGGYGAPVDGQAYPTTKDVTLSAMDIGGGHTVCIVTSSLGWTVNITPPDDSSIWRRLNETHRPSPASTPYHTTPVSYGSYSSYEPFSMTPELYRSVSSVITVFVVIAVVVLVGVIGFVVWVVLRKLGVVDVDRVRHAYTAVQRVIYRRNVVPSTAV
uniref:Membrane protein a158 n=1 Tax=Mastomys natalensis cytomegalovirus 2 TaxID=2973540 RepID=A0A9Y1IMC6_9BETA|nr:membrane protein a158 [Mastomys natalensis cytomegalovirus 2]WEG69284.1 membrane protein a158 [Mastomys natalensis cytomegalovirus 2]WEG69423.1 membrane protein a158 [Mastomys natalensis cytomegalovirus 2]WEG69561.1 membrane protein a158 [Mastomys natalensis cytomegalovirus 2]WEG69699.1 membrane protein a158 [Mastomys natalensis cytomegalovirus 2]